MMAWYNVPTTFSRREGMINVVASMETVRRNTSEWSDAKNLEKIYTQDNLYTKYRMTKINVEEGLSNYSKSRKSH